MEKKEKLTDTGLLVFQGFGKSYWTVSLDTGWLGQIRYQSTF
jgi:hypothetical protein